jgi:hypothetical protein
MSFIANNPILAAEATSPPPLPKKGTRGLFPKEDGWYDYDEMGNVTRVATSAELKKISENIEKLGNKQDELTFDDTPTEDSNNPVTSGGLFHAISQKSQIQIITWEEND